MFGFLKTFLQKRPSGQAESQEAAYAAPEETPLIEEAPEPISAAPAEGAPRTTAANAKGIQLPLQSILGGLPLELQSRVQQTIVGEAIIYVPLEKILSQLARGSVRISFGELRAGAPELFSSESDSDRVLVPLQCEPLVLQTTPQILRAIQDVVAHHPRLTFDGLLLTMYEAGNVACERTAAYVRSHVPANMVFDLVIPRSTAVSEAFAAGQPAVLRSPADEASQAYVNLASLLAGRFET